MADWLQSMQQTFEYYTVDPGTWKDNSLLTNVTSCTINRDLEADTLGSATIDIVDSLGEAYIRAYLIIIQNGVKEKLPLGTFLVQTPSSSFNGRMRSVTMDAYTPLLELKENMPPIGYSILKNANVMDMAYDLTQDYVRAPVVQTSSDVKLYYDFVANVDDTWMSFVKDLLENAKYTFELDELGRVLFSPKQDVSSLRPTWTSNDDNSSILYSDITMDHDLYGIPNVVEVIYSNGDDKFYAKVKNTDPNSPLSIENRGREIVHRITSPNIVGNATQYQITKYAEQTLKDLSSVEYTVSYTHGYCPVRIGDCVRLNYAKAGLIDVKAKVISQSIKCVPGTPVTEKAVFTAKLWGD